MDLSRYTITGEKERTAALKLQNERLIKLRWFYMTVLGAVASASYIIAGDRHSAYRYLLVGIVGLLLNSVLYFINRFALNKQAALKVLMALQLALDLSISALIVYHQGGLQARTAILFTLPIVATGLIFTYSVVYYTAIMSCIGYIASVYLYSINHEPLTVSGALVPLVFYPAYFMIFARLVVYLMRITTEDTREKAYDAYLALLSHQLKHPVSTVNTIVDLIEHSKNASPADQKKYIRMIKQQNQNLLLLLDNLLKTASPPSFVLPSDTADLAKLTQDIAYLCAETNSRAEDLKLSLHEMKLEVNGRHELLRVALANILNNAFQYSDRGTPITVSLHANDTSAMLTVINKSRKIDNSNLQRTSHKYNMQEYKEQGIQGLGLGLEVAQKVVQEHYGTMNIESTETHLKVTVTLNRSNNE